MRRNGLPRSEQATFTEHWIRHGNYLTITTPITDPVFLTEPLVRSQTWIFDPGQRMGATSANTPRSSEVEPNLCRAFAWNQSVSS